MGELAKHLTHRSPNTFPSDTVVNPKEECKAIVLRSGKVLEEDSEKRVDPQVKDQTVEDAPVTPTANGPSPIKSTSIPSSSS
ncbi:hypothetical protein PIB30_106781, partial [Stylosanthes scabra]|nr:hypothetical protein [Stylosanthes scabra]